MSDNRDQFGDDYNALTAKINKSYADKWNYKFIYEKVGDCYSPKGELRHPAWAKLLSTRKIMLSEKYDLLIYIDSDCIFKDHNKSIEDYLSSIKNIENNTLRKKTITFLNDIPWSNKMPCSGFYIVRGNNTKIFDDWFNSDLPHYNLNHTWEQKALYDVVLPKWSNDIEVINDVMFLEKKGQFLRHIGSHEGHLRKTYFNNFI